MATGDTWEKEIFTELVFQSWASWADAICLIKNMVFRRPPYCFHGWTKMDKMDVKPRDVNH